MNVPGLLKKNYNLLEIKLFKSLLCFVCPLVVFIFLLVFQPFGLGAFNTKERLMLVSLYSLPSVFIWYLLVYQFAVKIRMQYTIGTTILLLFVGNLLTAFSLFILHHLYFHEVIKLKDYPVFAVQEISTSLILFTVLVLLHQIHMLLKKTRTVNLINNANSIMPAKSDCKNINLKSSNNLNHFRFKSSQILFISSANNYVEVNWLENDILTKTLIRNTISNVEQNITKQCECFFRCHNSFIINTRNIERINGNTSSYKLKMKANEIVIPVSRKYGKELLSKLEQ